MRVIDVGSGRLIKDLKLPIRGTAECLAWSKDRIYVGQRSMNKVYGVSLTDSSALWHNTSTCCYTDARLQGDRLILSCTSNGGEMAYDAETGDPVWQRYRREGSWPVVIGDFHGLLWRDESGLSMLCPSDGEILWRRELSSESYVFARERGILFVHGNGEASGFFEATGTMAWKRELDSQPGALRLVVVR